MAGGRCLAYDLGWPRANGEGYPLVTHPAKPSPLTHSYSYTNKDSPGKIQDSPSRSRSRQDSQLCPSRDST
jgi:hypothetical protein